MGAGVQRIGVGGAVGLAFGDIDLITVGFLVLTIAGDTAGAAVLDVDAVGADVLMVIP